jgi:putative ABC transport system permease protein
MNFFESIRIAFRSLRANRMRAGLTMLGIIIGVAAVIALQGIGQGAQNAINSQIESMGTNLLFIQPGSTQQGGVRTATGSAASLTLEDARALADPASVPSVAAVAPETDAFAQVVAGSQNINVRIAGVTPEYETVRNMPVESGDFIQQAHVDSSSAVAVLGSTAASELFDGADPIDQTIYVNRVPFRVIGVLKSKGGGISNSDDTVLVPITTAQTRLTGNRFSRGGHVVSSINVQVIDKNNMSQAIEEISAVLRERHRIIYDDDFRVQNQQDMLQSVTQIMSILTLFLSSIAGISLLVGGIGIMNIMLVSVTERTREIGIRKAAGALGRDVLAQFLVEAIVLSVLGGALGILLGVGIGKLVSGINMGGMTLTAQVQLNSVLLAVAFSAAVGLFFGVYPAWRAAKLHPIDALRYE